MLNQNRPFVRTVFSFGLKACLCLTGIIFFSCLQVRGQDDILEKHLTIPRQHTTLYLALNIISQKSEVFFIYDSKVVDNNKKVKLEANNQPLRKVLDGLLSSPELDYKVIGQHILIYKAKTAKPPAGIAQAEVLDTIKKLVIEGTIFDNESKTAIPFATVGIVEENIGTITNSDGYFKLKLPATLAGSSLIVSHMGYLSQSIPLELVKEQKIDIYLSRKIISIQEVIIRYIDPKIILQKALEQRKYNYNTEPVYTTSFYREGVQKNKQSVSYSEAVFKVYKSSYTRDDHSDQVKLLKSRKIQNVNSNDTVYVKLKAGILSALQLDIVKCIPDFMNMESLANYTYTYSDLISFGERDAYAITFEQNKFVHEALFMGTLYIDKENFAILGADFEINPDYIDLALDNLIQKKSRRLSVKFEKIKYSVSYKLYGGKYYLNHARCDLNLKTRLRNRISSDNFNTFLELATCTIDTLNVSRFQKTEVLKKEMVFSEGAFQNDDPFWSVYNIITPEEQLSKALSKIIGKIEEIK